MRKLFLFVLITILSITYSNCENIKYLYYSYKLKNSETNILKLPYDVLVEEKVNNILSKSINNRKIDKSELITLKNYIHNLEMQFFGIAMIINNQGKLLIHKNERYENSYINEYEDFKNGLEDKIKKDYDLATDYSLYNQEIKKKQKYAVYIAHIKELDLIFITITPRI